ncbi:MAG: hydroxymethylbilane synthase [Cyanobacteriota bacterium]
MKKIRIGTRGSKLALWQANYIKDMLEKENTEFSFELVIIKTSGDKILDVALSKIGDKGLFTKELENSLINNETDLAVHSMKDVPTNLHEKLFISCMPKREDTNDIFISNKYDNLENLPKNAKIGTSSIRRKAQLSYFRKDLEYLDIRGNVDTRLKKLDDNEYDGIILAYAGIHRLGLDSRVTQKIPFNISLPAVGQGAIGIEIRKNDDFIKTITNKINHLETFFCVSIERVFMNKLEGGCQVPIACQAFFEGKNLIIKALVSDVDGNKIITENITEKLSFDEIITKSEDEIYSIIQELGLKISDLIIKSGGLDVIRGIR